jgi:threonine/homoserine/homoserine lactone efflux protein
VLVFQVIPGPGTLAILNATARNGVSAGMGAVAGTLLGDFIYMLAAAVGLATVMRANQTLFNALQWFGAGYLVWMGLRLLRAQVTGAQGTPEPRRTGWIYFRQAFAVSLTNPKVALFFVAFFPLFLRADSSPVTLGMLMLHVTVLSLLYQGGLVLTGNAVARQLASLPAARRLATRLAGAALIGFGAQLALGNR